MRVVGGAAGGVGEVVEDGDVGGIEAGIGGDEDPGGSPGLGLARDRRGWDGRSRSRSRSRGGEGAREGARDVWTEVEVEVEVEGDGDGDGESDAKPLWPRIISSSSSRAYIRRRTASNCAVRVSRRSERGAAMSSSSWGRSAPAGDAAREEDGA